MIIMQLENFADESAISYTDTDIRTHDNQVKTYTALTRGRIDNFSNIFIRPW